MRQGLSLLLFLGCCFFSQASISNSVSAQVTPDGTTNTTVNVEGDDVTIEQGERAGNNLFHSFRDFSVSSGGSAFFDNPDTIENIFSRVTGGNISSIDGLIRANNANLFLINPAGIIFGAGARLDIGGSFYGSSADSILFPDDIEFSASNSQTEPLLTINAPIGLGFRDNPGDIVNRSVADEVGLQVYTGKTLGLIGGNVSLEGGLTTASAGRIEIGSVGDNNTVSLTAIADTWQLDYEGVDRFQNIELSQDAMLKTSLLGTAPPFRDSPILANREQTASPGGDIQLRGQNITINPGSFLIATGGSRGGDITIEGANIEISQGSEARNPSLATTGGIQGGNITITGQQIIITEGSTQNSPRFPGDPQGDNVDTIDADSLSNRSGGNITIDGQQIEISNEVKITSESWNFSGDFDASNIANGSSEGDILIGVNDDNSNITISDRASIVTDTHGFHDNNDIPANASSITIGNLNSENIVIQSGSEIAAESHSHTPQTGGNRDDFDSGDAGSITIQGQKVTITGLETDVTATAFGSGAGGDIIIDGKQFVRIEEQANVVAETSGATDTAMAGDIMIGHNHDSSEINVNNARVSVTTGETIAESHGNDPEKGLADAGNISIGNVNSLINVTDGSFITSLSTFDNETFNNTNDTLGIGNGGDIEFVANEFNLVDSSVTTTSNFEGIAGAIVVDAVTFNLDNASLSAETQSGKGGNIDLAISEVLTLSNNSIISTEAFRDADGGNITIDADFIIAYPRENNDIVANALGGEGGNITIFTEGIFGIEERPLNDTTNDISASSQSSLDGDISITNPDVDAIQGTVELATNVIEPGQTTAQACAANRENVAHNGLTIKGKGGIPPEPSEPLNPDAIIFNGQYLTTFNSQPDIQPIKTSIGDIIPARGVIVTEAGEVILTPYPTNNRDSRSPYSAINCGKA